MLSELPAGTPLLRPILDEGELAPKPDPNNLALAVNGLNELFNAPGFTLKRLEPPQTNNATSNTDDQR